MKILACVFILLTLAFGDSSAKVVPSEQEIRPLGDYIIVGTFCGECGGHCATMYMADSTALYIDSNDSYFSRRAHMPFFSSPVSILNTTAHHSEYQTLHHLLTKLPKELMTSVDSTFGQPDASDQCGFYLEFRMNGQKKIFRIDTFEREVPPKVAIFSREIASVIENLNKSIWKVK